MAGNGYYAEGLYQTKSTETWASLTGAWSSYTSWQYTPNTPLEFTTEIVDFGRVDYVNYDVVVGANYPHNTTIYYGDTVDSSGGSIDNVSTLVVGPDETLASIKARYFQFKISVDYADSASTDAPIIRSIDSNLKQSTKTVSLNGLNTADFTGSAGERQLATIGELGTITGAVVTPHSSSAAYVATGYVVSDDSAGESYVEIGDVTLPHIVIDKTTDPITLRVRDLNTYGKTKIDCKFDAVLTGLPIITSDADGNIRSGG